jgi:hypothetical protein
VKVSIVFEETENRDGGVGFNVYLDGLSKERRQYIDSLTPEQQLQELSTTEFWALRCFQITVHAMKTSGAIRETKPR